MSQLEGKVALVTGGGRGLGHAIALELARSGADVVVNYFRNRTPAEATAEAIRALGRRAHVVKANVGDEEKLDALFDEVRAAFGGLDILISNAASGVLKPVEEIGAREWDWAMDINARALLLCANRAAPLMRARGGGAIIAVTSIGSQRVFPYYATVGISKAALEAAVRYLAIAYAKDGIAVNAVSPGAMDTDALRHFPNRETIIESSIRNTPSGRLVTPEEVARIVRFLCTEEARPICGQVIVIDGGYSLVTFA